MFALLASFLLIAAGEPVAPPAVSDAEVVRLLKPTELAEWHNAMRVTDLGKARVKQGQSIMSTSIAAAIATKGAKVGGLTETPEQIKVRAQKIIDEGNLQIQKAAPSLARLRLTAAQRFAETTKPINFSVSLPAAAPAAALDAAVGRLHKQAVDLGYPSAHLIGSLRFSAAGLERPADLTADLRAAWSRRAGVALAAVPAEGYAYVPGVAPAAPALSKGLKPATAPKQLAVLWAEQYALTTDGSQALLFLRLADAHSFQLVASELVLVEQRAGATPAACGFLLRDDRSFVPRLTQGGTPWVFGFERDSQPIGSALLAHICLSQTKLSVAADAYVAIVAGGGPAGGVVGARWRATVAEAPAGSIAFQVEGVPVGGAAVPVGLLTVRVGPPVAK
ncbi:MAG: hypothetical protein EBR95_03945 [Verrucomicrobia bacterium]|nr:hypothetical protein [Verrucomicrobiota bacterium]